MTESKTAVLVGSFSTRSLCSRRSTADVFRLWTSFDGGAIVAALTVGVVVSVQGPSAAEENGACEIRRGLFLFDSVDSDGKLA